LTVRIDYKESVFRDLKRIGMPEAKRIINKLEKILREDPGKGERLKGKFQGLLKLKVGDYRVIYTKTREGVLILRIGHRKHIFR
jgi:mRNA interferase RelE/StbE